MNITKYKQLNITEHKTDMNITEKLNSTSTAEYRTTINITEKLSSIFTINRTQLHFGESNNKHATMVVSCFDKAE